MSQASLKALFLAYAANLGRQPTAEEGAEFDHHFRSADLTLLRRAIDDYFATTPRYPVLPELHAIYRRLVPARTGGNDDAAATAWLNGPGPGLCGFRFEGGEEVNLGAGAVRTAMLRHDTAWADHPQWPRLWSSGSAVAARDAMRIERALLEPAGWVYIGHGGPNGLIEIHWRREGWEPVLVQPPGGKAQNAEQLAKLERAFVGRDLQSREQP